MASLMARTAGAVLVLLGAGGIGRMFSSRFLTRLRLLEEARLICLPVLLSLEHHDGLDLTPSPFL